MSFQTFRILVWCLFAYFCVRTRASDHSDHPCNRACVGGEPPRTCEYNFTVEWYYVLSKACHECPFNESDCFRPHCVSADGLFRPILTVNRQLPGPAIEVCQNDRVVVWVHNEMEDGSSTSIHWHGQHQRGTPYMDGVGLITQCNIPYREIFKYDFRASTVGTHFYHSHTGLQLADGLMGPFIVRTTAEDDPNSLRYDVDSPRHVVMVFDWMNTLVNARYLQEMHDIWIWPVPMSALINGRGRRFNVTNRYNMVNTTRTEALTPVEVFDVTSGLRHRFRVIGAAPRCPFQISIDNHSLTIIASDGASTKPMLVDSFLVHPGERFDFVLEADQAVANYWFKAIGQYDCLGVKANAYAILRYIGAPTEDPEGDPNIGREGTLLNPLLVAKAPPFSSNGPDNDIAIDQLQHGGDPENFTEEKVDVKLYIGMDFNTNDDTKYNNKNYYSVHSLHPVKTHYTPVMDNITFLMPPVPLLSQPEDVDPEWFCNASTVNMDQCLEDLCLCTHTLAFGKNQVVELIIVNNGATLNQAHPMHLHGNYFRVLGSGKMNRTIFPSEIRDLDSRGQLPRNLINPVYKDTVNVNRWGYVIIRFIADNPGFWLFHCHTDAHLAQGKALVIKVGDYGDFPPVPDHFPRCGGYGYNKIKTPEQEKCPVSAGIGMMYTMYSYCLVGYFSILVYMITKNM